MDTLTTDIKESGEGFGSNSPKQPESPGCMKRPHSESSGEVSCDAVGKTKCNWNPCSPTSKLFRMDAHLHPQLLTNYLQQNPAVCPQVALHTSASSSNELKLDELASDTQEKVSRKIEWTPELMAQQMRRLRQWEMVTNTKFASGQEFTLMSYNILAQRLLESNSELYKHCDQEVLNWNYRCDHIVQELIEADPDIVCLQEVQEDHLEQTLMPRLQEHGYLGLYKKRTGDKSDGCAIFFKKNQFALEGWLPVEFNKPGVYVLNRDNIGIVALFRPLRKKKTDARLCVATTHLLFNPRRGDVKLAQLQVLFAEMDRLAFRRLSSSGHPLYHPVIVCGDMNSEPQCEIYKFMSSGSLHYEGLPIATMSGQVGSGWTRNYLSPELLPPYLGITDHCQFAKIQQDRVCKCQPSQKCEQMSKSDETMDVAGGSSSSASEACSGSSEMDDQTASTTDKLYVSPVYASGVMRHSFNLMSVYNHALSRKPYEPEVTTQHTRASCTVDYIFYSVKNKRTVMENDKLIHKHVSEMDLKLLGKYSLVSDNEIRSLGGLPNAVCPSDHLPLLAKFSLDL